MISGRESTFLKLAETDMTPDEENKPGAGTEEPAAAETGTDNNDGPAAESAQAKAESAWAKASDEQDAPEADDAAELKSRLLHTLADMDNLRKRTEREIADSRKYAVSNFAREMLTVRDNLQRALDAVPDELREGDNKAATALVEGVEVTARSLEQTLEKFGVARIETDGAKFDPAFHQAMMEVDDPDREPGTVAAEIQSGYAIGDRVLRPAFVSVVKKRKVKVEVKNDAGPSANDGGDNATADTTAGQ